MKSFINNFNVGKGFIMLSLFVLINAQLSNCKANDFDNLYCLANQLLKAEQYNDAITEYKRVLFKHANENHLAKQKIAYCYLQLGEVENSIKFIDRAIANAKTETLRSEMNLNKVVIFLYFGDYNNAIHIATREYYFSTNEFIKCHAASLLLFSYVVSGNLEQAAVFSTDNDHLSEDCDYFQHISSKLSEINMTKHKNPDRAKRLSTFMPGLGQVYSGKTFEGINAFLVNTGLVFWFTYSLINADYANAILPAALFQSFYRGNIHRAFEMAVEYNNELDSFLIHKIINSF